LKKKKDDKKQLVILIKPGQEASYENVVNVLDEMLINSVRRYSVVDPEKEETNFLKRYN